MHSLVSIWLQRAGVVSIALPNFEEVLLKKSLSKICLEKLCTDITRKAAEDLARWQSWQPGCAAAISWMSNGGIWEASPGGTGAGGVDAETNDGVEGEGGEEDG
jgi:hypothetical protein